MEMNALTCCFMAFSSFLIHPANSQTLSPFYFNLSDFKEYDFPCGERFRCKGFVQFCGDDLRCSYCAEDFCRSKSKMPGQCQVMCRLLGYSEGSGKDQKVDETNTESPTYPTKQLSDPNTDVGWRNCAIVTSALLGMVLICNAVYFLWEKLQCMRMAVQKAVTEALEKRKPDPIVTNPTLDEHFSVPYRSSGGYHAVMPEPGSELNEETKELQHQ